MSALAAKTARRRFLLISAMRWFPGGLVLPILVLLMVARGIDLVTIGSLFAGFSALVALFELPTGGLADVVGRRPVFLGSAALNAGALAMLALARDAWQFGLALGVFGIGRALSSGPLHAWYVDAAQAADPNADLQPALSREGLVSSVSLGSGVLIGGLLPGAAARLYPGLPTEGDGLLLTLTIPVWTASALLALVTIALALLMTEDRTSAPAVGGCATLRRVFSDVPFTMTRSVRFITKNRPVWVLLLSVFTTGLVISATEVLAPTFFAEVMGDESRAAVVYGALLTAIFFASGFGSAAAPAVSRRARGPMRGAAVAALLGALAYGALGAAHNVAVASTMFIVVYLALGAIDPLRQEQLHLRTRANERASMLSVESMAQMLGGVVGSLTVPRLANVYGFGLGWLACAAVGAVCAALVLLVPDGRPTSTEAAGDPIQLSTNPDHLS